MKNTLPFIILTFGLFLAGCYSESTQNQPSGKIDGTDFSRHVAVLAHDSLEGRMPFTSGEAKTITYLSNEFARLGLQPGNKDSFFQEVPLVEIDSKPAGNLVIGGRKKTLNLRYLDEFVANSRQVTQQVRLQNSELVFAGYGIVAPEFEWNDYDGLDVRGKTVVVLVNDPGYADSTLFRGKNMTYYGRWTYKFEEAGRQGAAGVLIMHDQGPASYGWNVVRGGWSGPRLDLENKDGSRPAPLVEGWISNESALSLLEAAGQSPDLLQQASQKGFRAVPLGLSASLTLKNSIRKSVSHNVLALWPGSDRKDEYVVYMAHWDHLGTGEKIDGDSIYNGAVDNATGTAALFEIAKAFVHAPEKPSRSVLFLAVTAEEQGLLGSAYYSANPVYPPSRTVAAINIDALLPVGRTKDVIVVGKGQSELDEYVENAAKKQGRYTRGEKNPSGGTYYRSDHFNFAKIGVPALYINTGIDLWNGGTQAGEARHKEYGENRYHAPADHYSPNWDMSGIIEDLQLLFDIGNQLSNGTTLPGWKEGSEFKSIRENSLNQL